MILPTPIVRIVVVGSPQKWRVEVSPDGERCDKPISPNFHMARKMLREAVDSDAWPSARVLFTVTPGGFIHALMPEYRSGISSWASRACDFRSLVPSAEEAVREVIDEDLRAKLAKRSRFLTVGVDLMPKGQAKVVRGRRTRGETNTRAELVGVLDLHEGGAIRWTGKSYPVSGEEERVLVQEPCLESHLLRVAGQRVLVLGCHDLNMFNGRARALAKYARRERWQKMDALARQFNPTMVLHHPHQTDSPTTWRQGWSGLRRCLGFDGPYASSIAYFPHGWKARCSLEAVLAATKSGDDVIDIRAKGFWGRDWGRYR